MPGHVLPEDQSEARSWSQWMAPSAARCCSRRRSGAWGGGGASGEPGEGSVGGELLCPAQQRGMGGDGEQGVGPPVAGEGDEEGVDRCRWCCPTHSAGGEAGVDGRGGGA